MRTFLAVAEAASFSRAAQQLHLTQPAVSKRIQSLESSLGVALFDRIGKRVYLTDAGRLLKPRAQLVLDAVKDTETLLKNLHARVDGRLKLATSHHVGLHRLAPVLKAFTSTHPQVELDIRFLDSEQAHALVADGEVELAVVTLDPSGEPALDAHVLWHDPLEFVVAEDHALAREQAISIERLSAWPAILPDLGTYTGRIVVDHFERVGVPIRTAMATNYLETIGMLVGIGLGWSVLPRTLVKSPIVRADVDCTLLGRELGYVINPARTLSNAAHTLIAVLKAYRDSNQPGF